MWQVKCCTQETTMQNVRQIPFEVSEQHLLGLRTELSALKIVSDVAKHLQAKVRRMVLPPKPAAWPRGIGECDAILLTDVAVFLVEVKRYGVQVKLLDDTSPQLAVVRDRKEEQIRNPALEVCSKSDSLQQLLRELPEWRLVNKLFDVARVQPVFRSSPYCALAQARRSTRFRSSTET
jgi:hypothetical protein